MNKMLVYMTGIFGICWCPLTLMDLVERMYPEISCVELFRLIFYISHVIAMSSTCYNPFLYGLMNPAFKSEFTKICSCFLKTRAGDNSESVDSYGTTRETEEESQVLRISRYDPTYKYFQFIYFSIIESFSCR